MHVSQYYASCQRQETKIHRPTTSYSKLSTKIFDQNKKKLSVGSRKIKRNLY